MLKHDGLHNMICKFPPSRKGKLYEYIVTLQTQKINYRALCSFCILTDEIPLIRLIIRFGGLLKLLSCDRKIIYIDIKLHGIVGRIFSFIGLDI